MRRLKKNTAIIFKIRFQNKSALSHCLWPNPDPFWSWNLRLCLFFWRLIILLTDPTSATKQGQTFGVPTFHINFMNPECVRIPLVLALKNFPIENFRVRSDLQKKSIFHWFLLPPPKKKYRARVPTILMPQTFPIASLNRYTPNFSGVPQKLT